jgi:two-component sensor histidine kinase
MSAHETVIQFPQPRIVALDMREDERPDATAAKLQATLGREDALRNEIGELLRRQEASAREFERRLSNGLEAIAGQLTLQSKTAATPEAAAQLRVAARRTAAMARSQSRLRRHDH